MATELAAVGVFLGCSWRVSSDFLCLWFSVWMSSLFWLRSWAFFVGGWLDVFHYLRAIWWLRNWPRSGFFLLSASACCANAFNVYHVYTPTHYGTPSAVYYRHLPRGRHGEAPYGTALHGTPRHCTALHRHCTAPRPFFMSCPPPKIVHTSSCVSTT